MREAAPGPLPGLLRATTGVALFEQGGAADAVSRIAPRFAAPSAPERGSSLQEGGCFGLKSIRGDMFIIDARDVELAEVQAKIEWLEHNPQPCMVLIQSAEDESAIKRSVASSFSGVRWVVTPKPGARGVRLPVSPSHALTDAGHPPDSAQPEPALAPPSTPAQAPKTAVVVAGAGVAPTPAPPVVVAQRFPALRLIAGLLKFVAVLVVGSALLVGVVAVGLVPAEHDRTVAVLSAVAGLVVSALFGVLIWGLAEMLLVLIAIEENTRTGRDSPST